MKKILILVILLMIVPVYAKENKLYLINDNKEIKYESGLYDEKVFMRHMDMVPGSKYTDELTIENSGKTPIKLYLKLQKKEQTLATENLLNNIILKIKIDDEIIYEGKANGTGNINLLDSVYLGEFASNKSAKMVVDTYLSVDYENPKEDDYSKIEWTFYAQIEEEPPKEVVPITGSNKDIIIYIIAALLLIIAIALFIKFMYKKNEKAI